MFYEYMVRIGVAKDTGKSIKTYNHNNCLLFMQGKAMSEGIASGSLSEARQRGQKRERKLVRVCSALLIYFAVAWMPLVVMIYIGFTCGDCVNKYVR